MAEDSRKTRRRDKESGKRGVRVPGAGPAGYAAVGSDVADRPYLGQEMGVSLDDDGSPLPVTLKELYLQPALMQLTLRLLEDFGAKRAEVGENLHKAGLTEADLWKPGITETLSTSSTPDEIDRYRLKLRFRADFLEAALEETLLELEELDQAKSTSVDTPAEAAGKADNHTRGDGH